MKLLLNAAVKFVCGLLALGILIFIPAGTLEYKNGWLFFALLFIPMLILGLIMFLKAPELLKKRLDSKEESPLQKGVAILCGFIFVGGFVVAGLDYRFGWSRVPDWVIVTASFVLLASYAFYAEVMRENSYLSRTVKVEEDQKVIDTGLYKIVRHPMYTSTIFLFLSIPVVLGSWFALAFFVIYPIIIIIRLLGEEKLLEREFPAYTEYKKRVKYRLFPFVW